MIIKYSEFINENINKARRVLRETNKLETDKDFIELRELLRNNAGYLGKFTEWHFVDKIPLDRLKNLYNTIYLVFDYQTLLIHLRHLKR